MDELQGVLDWVRQWPLLTLALLALACLGESILVLGALIPTTVVLFAAGALVAFGVFEFWQVTFAATFGAMAGDYLNFWIGRHYGEQVLDSKWAQRNAAAVARSRRIMQRNEVKGLFIGRYVGLVRPFISALAGAHGMPAWRFLAIEFLTCLSWAAGLIAVGFLFSASLALAAEVATRLATLIVILLLLFVIAVWASRHAVVFLQDHAERWTQALLDWSHRHRRLGRLGEALADPQQPETPGLAIAAALLLVLGAGWMALVWGLGWREYPPALDAFVYQSLQDLHTPWATAAAVALAQLGEWQVYLPVALAVLFCLAGRRRRAAAHWIAALLFAGVIALGLFALPTFSNPLEFYRGELRAHFSGRELVLSTVTYGFLAVLLSTHRAAGERAAIYGAAATLVLLILLAELYLGAQWFSLALFSIVLGLLWTATLGLGYRRHRIEAIALARVLPLTLTVFAAAAIVHWTLGFEVRADAARPKWKLSDLSAQVWWNGGWQKLPAQRVDMAGRGKTRFNLQWAGGLKEIETAMAEQGWRWPVRPSAGNLLHWLSESADIGQLPVLPQVHAGRHQALMLRRDEPGNRQTLIQLWPSAWRIEGGERIWVGQIAVQSTRTRFRMFTVPAVQDDALPSVTESFGALPAFEMKAVADESLWLLRSRTTPSDAGVGDDD